MLQTLRALFSNSEAAGTATAGLISNSNATKEKSFDKYVRKNENSNPLRN